jgi:FtsP/CotA-like multicopper oxidase with cupredoxin domain
MNPDGKQDVDGITANGVFPGPEIRARLGEQLRIRVENHLPDQATSIHWHGLLVPAGMDGVPDVSNAPIGKGRMYLYEYPLLQSGTYWYHSHVKLQEQIGLAGPLVIEDPEETPADHDASVMLSDWLHRSPYVVFEELRKPKTMAMKPKGGPDLADIEYPTFLLNGRSTSDPWTLEARPGERIRLRFVNAGSSTYFHVALDGHPLEITHADGLAVQPVVVDHLLMGMAECYDANVSLSGSGSYTLHAVAQDGSGQAIGVIHTPDAAPKPNRQMPQLNRRALSYAALRALAPTTLPDGPTRRFNLPLQGDMSRYVWMIDGQAYPKADPLLIRTGDRVLLEMKNETLMWHPMHLHGHYFRVLQGAGDLCPLKHTANVAPGETVRVEFTADNPGRWFFHCHNLYHLDAGMARVFEYET